MAGGRSAPGLVVEHLTIEDQRLDDVVQTI
jgi:hypothetical protein